MPITVEQTQPGAETGLSLVELMVAVVIGSVIMLGAATLFLQSKISYVQDEELARLQEGGRFAIRYLARELSMAGYYGGVLRGSDISVDAGVADPNGPSCYDYMFRTEVKFEHFNDAGPSTDFSTIGMPEGTGTENCLDSSDLQPDNDIIVIRRVKDSATVWQGDTADGASVSANTMYLEVEDFNVSIALNNVTGTVAADTDLWEYLPQIVYVRNYATDPGDGIPTLCRRGISRAGNAMADPQCLVQGVEDMHFEFGLDTDDDYVVDTYSSAPSEADLTTALSAGVYLLLRSPNAVTGYTNDKNYTLGSKPVAAADDGYYRRVIQSTTTLRNSDALGLLR